MQQPPCHKISISEIRIFLKKKNINTHTLLLFSHRKDGSIPLDRTTFLLKTWSECSELLYPIYWRLQGMRKEVKRPP